MVTVCKVHWLVSRNSRSTNEPITKHRFLWRHSDHCNHGHGSVRKLGERLGDCRFVLEPGSASEMG
ncbi:hypothetical protein SynMVIR181_01735 [Synechococcus sp. MVIR-18-1]|nr:hypothetical protein SynMVIR181_01735 [Synechococcus sp. MVIR-18-1]